MILPLKHRGGGGGTCMCHIAYRHIDSCQVFFFFFYPVFEKKTLGDFEGFPTMYVYLPDGYPTLTT